MAAAAVAQPAAANRLPMAGSGPVAVSHIGAAGGVAARAGAEAEASAGHVQLEAAAAGVQDFPHGPPAGPATMPSCAGSAAAPARDGGGAPAGAARALRAPKLCAAPAAQRTDTKAGAEVAMTGCLQADCGRGGDVGHAGLTAGAPTLPDPTLKQPAPAPKAALAHAAGPGKPSRAEPAQRAAGGSVDAAGGAQTPYLSVSVAGPPGDGRSARTGVPQSADALSGGAAQGVMQGSEKAEAEQLSGGAPGTGADPAGGSGTVPPGPSRAGGIPHAGEAVAAGERAAAPGAAAAPPHCKGSAAVKTEATEAAGGPPGSGGGCGVAGVSPVKRELPVKREAQAEDGPAKDLSK